MQNIQTEWIGAGPNPKKRKRYLLVNKPDTQSITALSAEWRQLLIQCVKKSKNARLLTWKKIAGLHGKVMLEQLLALLLKHGWVCVYEQLDNGSWWPYRTEFQHYESLRTLLGLSNVGVLIHTWQALRRTLQDQAELNQDLALQVALSNLDAMPAARAITRATLVQSLLSWSLDGRIGTYRDFSLYARGATKEVSKTERDWLDTHFDLAEFNIEQHTPLLLVSANVYLHTDLGEINLQAMPDFSALTPATVSSVRTASGKVTSWILVENRTSFERVARSRQEKEGVIWLPGYPPSWWKEAVSHLIKIIPAPASVACDPDPAGIAIALSAIALFNASNLPATAWKMGVDALEKLPNKKSLSEFDQQQLSSLLKQDLPVELKVLADYMQSSQVKGEQEGYL